MSLYTYMRQICAFDTTLRVRLFTIIASAGFKYCLFLSKNWIAIIIEDAYKRDSNS